MEPGLGNHLLSPERAEVSRHVRPGCWHRLSGRPSWTRCAWTPLSSRTHRPARASMAAPPPRSQRRDAALLPAPGLQERPRSGDPALPQNLPVWPSGPVRAIPPATVLRRPSGAGFLGRFSRPSAALRWGLRSVLPAFGVLSVFSTSLP